MQAAIQAVHSDAATAAATDWRQILQLYDELLALAPSAVVALNRAVALAGILALFTVAGLILAILLSIAQDLWIVSAAVAIRRSAGSPARPPARGGQLT